MSGKKKERVVFVTSTINKSEQEFKSWFSDEFKKKLEKKYGKIK